jgi:hypothetical protein
MDMIMSNNMSLKKINNYFFKTTSKKSIRTPPVISRDLNKRKSAKYNNTKIKPENTSNNSKLISTKDSLALSPKQRLFIKNHHNNFSA